MPCKFVSHIKWPLKGTELEERSGSDGRPWLASRLHPSSLTVPPPTTAAAAGEGEELVEGGGVRTVMYGGSDGHKLEQRGWWR